MHQFVRFLVQRLCLNVGELVLAYACVERALVTHRTLMRTYSVRSMLLGACVIACKVSRDHEVKLHDCFGRVRDVLNRLQLKLLARIEHQMLECLHWRLPMGRIYQTYADALFAAASCALGLPLDVPHVLADWEAPRERTPLTCRAAATAIQRRVRGRVARCKANETAAVRRGATALQDSASRFIPLRDSSSKLSATPAATVAAPEPSQQPTEPA